MIFQRGKVLSDNNLNTNGGVIILSAETHRSVASELSNQHISKAVVTFRCEVQKEFKVDHVIISDSYAQLQQRWGGWALILCHEAFTFSYQNHPPQNSAS